MRLVTVAVLAKCMAYLYMSDLVMYRDATAQTMRRSVLDICGQVVL